MKKEKREHDFFPDRHIMYVCVYLFPLWNLNVCVCLGVLLHTLNSITCLVLKKPFIDFVIGGHITEREG